MIEERFESYVYQIMKYVKYQENKPYIEDILEDMRYTLFREDRLYIKDLEQRIDKVIKYIDIETKGCDEEPIEGSWLYDLYTIRDILGDKENE